ncbi:MAG: hypothetical protein PHE09_12290 [Oscillospiraceae bacterium]|nr:hypothetical protein [Oscillospiraceae bacterium]
MLNLHLTRSNVHEGVYLHLPATPAEIGEAWAALDGISDDVSSTRIIGTASNVWTIGRYLNNANINDPEQIKKLNRIAEITDSLDLDQCRLFQGALDAESVNNLDDIIAIGERLEQYLYIPHITTDRELGIFLVDSDVMPFDENVRPYLDYARIGIEYYANHGGSYTAGGYVVSRYSAEQALQDIVDIRQNRQTLGGMKME